VSLNAKTVENGGIWLEFVASKILNVQNVIVYISLIITVILCGVAKLMTKLILLDLKLRKVILALIVSSASIVRVLM